MDIIVTTPKSQMANAAREAANCIRDGGGEYFRKFSYGQTPAINVGERVYYVEDGYIRGFAVVSSLAFHSGSRQCQTTGRWYPCGSYVFMPAHSWQWIKPIPMQGFQGFRYADKVLILKQPVEIVGGWLDPKPPTP